MTSEITSDYERANLVERTKKRERAISPESTAELERAITAESAKAPERSWFAVWQAKRIGSKQNRKQFQLLKAMKNLSQTLGENQST